MHTKQTILIVDDVSENVDILVELLSDHDLVTALDGQTALDIVDNETIDLILLDIMMPNMNGYEVCKILKRQALTATIPVIFLSAKDKQDDIQDGFSYGAVDYITKPFHPEELLSRVDTHLKLRAYEKHLEEKVQEEIDKNKIKEQMIHQQSKQAALGDLLMHIAHQWKQPLASLGSINMIQRTKVENDLELSKETHLKALIKSEDLIIFMSQTVETFRNFYQPSDEDNSFLLTDAVKKVINISDATLNYHNIKLTLNSNEKIPFKGCENEIAQVVFSIINNAREIFIQREIKNPHINILISNNLITISDNAGGIDDDIMDNIFLPYKSSTNGNGIGLYIAKEIVEKNGGLISVMNGELGAIFKVEFLTWFN